MSCARSVLSKRAFDENTYPMLSSTSDQRKKTLKEGVCIDPKHLKLLKPHQVEGVNFLLACLTRSQLSPDALPTGAILADDVGTGKTLIGLITIYTLTRHFNKKGIIVCPSSLVMNWKNEVKKWFPDSLFYSTVFVKSNHQSDSLVFQFIHSSSEIRPLLIISYDLFRSFSEALNTLPNLEYLLCDEGHRLKNAYGTKTIDALASCVATKRIVMSGTPIQNNLEELYSIVQFVCPFFLGTLEEFRAKYISDSEGRTEELKRKLSQILLRRSKDVVLRAELPPRNEFLVKCPLLLDSERGAYARLAEDSISAFTSQGDRTSVLSKLMELRLVCSLPPGAKEEECDAASVSTKMRALMALVSAVSKGNADKIVIVSGFTSVLDAVQRSLRRRRLTCLRIDGAVSLDRRDKIVQAFNNLANPIRILLLSAKAGGVGLTLTGANHICLMEPDWNPAVDTQAAGRVWRPGQTKPVFVYRMLMSGTVEESIIRRQDVKRALGNILEDEMVIDLDIPFPQNCASMMQLVLPGPDDKSMCCDGAPSIDLEKYPSLVELSDVSGVTVHVLSDRN